MPDSPMPTLSPATLSSTPAACLTSDQSRPSLLTGYPAALFLILIMFALGLFATLSESPTSDEPAHIVGGYVHYTLGQPRIHTENGYLAQAIAAFPLLFLPPHLNIATDAFKYAEVFSLGRDFLYHSGNNPDQILFLARLMIGLLAAATVLAVYAWSRALFSPAAGILSLLLFAFSPVVLAHGFLATSDMTATCFFVLALGGFWLTLKTLTPLRLLLSTLFFSALCLSKMSAPLILPVLLLLSLIHILSRRPLPWKWTRARHGEFSTRFRKSAAVAFILLVHTLVACTIIWAAYDFTFSAFKDSPPHSGQTLSPPDGWQWALQSPTLTLRAIAFARDHHLLPEAYLYGYAHVAHLSQQHNVFVNGSYDAGSWWFFPYMFLLTTPIPFLLLVLLASILAYKKLRAWRIRHPAAADLPARLHALAPVLLFFLLYWLAVLPNYRNATGPRHLLPAYAMLCILLGACAVWKPHRPLLKKILLTLLPLWFLIEVAAVYPHNLSYFNEFVGGPSQGYRYLSDSSVDWGQDLPALATYLRTHNPNHLPVYFSYFGNAETSHYGIHAHPLPSFYYQVAETDPAQVQPLAPGLYCVSTSMFGKTAEMSASLEPLSHIITMQQFLHMIAYFQSRKPLAQAGYSINIYQLSAADLRAALAPPPADAVK